MKRIQKIGCSLGGQAIAAANMKSGRIPAGIRATSVSTRAERYNCLLGLPVSLAERQSHLAAAVNLARANKARPLFGSVRRDFTCR
jgi:hypothetical protein